MTSRSISSRPVTSRRMLGEVLESRRLLAAEGVGVDISRIFTTTGLSGSLSSTVRWGDNTETAGSVSGAVDNNGPLSIRFEYVGNFFNDPARRTLLENAAASVIERFSDDLEPIVTDSLLQWTAVTTNPATGAELTIPNLQVAANQLVVYVGARNFAGNRVGEAFPGFARTSFPGQYTQDEINRIQDFQETIQFRGESGANAPNPTDIGPWGGYISFDSDTDWHFGASKDGLDDDEVDFQTVAVHEMMHLLGFGVRYGGSTNSSFETVSNGTSFTGPKSRALFGGNVPLQNEDHFADEVESNGQQSVISPSVDKGIRKVLTPLDLAALDDIGWTVRTAPNATVTATHIYADNPDAGTNYPVEVILRGSQFGEVTQALTTSVTNTPPTLTVPPSQSVEVGRAFTLANLGEISDPGFSSSAAGSNETFTYTINWGDGTTDSGDATIDRNGNGTLTTLASFDGSHTYDSVGTFTVGVSTTDDDGGTDTANFTITVTPPPQLTLNVSQSTINENAGAAAATLTISRSGPARSTAQTIQLTSDDVSEATVATMVTIPANQTSVTTPINAIDDALLDGTQMVTFTASASGVTSDDASISVADAETLSASFVGGNITEGDTTSVALQITRSNTNVDAALTINITGGQTSQLTFQRPVSIPAGQRTVSVPLTPVQDEQAELTKTLDYVFSATGYPSTNASVDILDDEAPLFQNADNRFDTDGNSDLTPNDILTVINQLVVEGSNVVLDPEARQLAGIFYDVDGNYMLTPNDILEVINQLAQEGSQTTAPPSGELIEASASTQIAATTLSASSLLNNDDDDEESLLAYGLEPFVFIV